MRQGCCIRGKSITGRRERVRGIPAEQHVVPATKENGHALMRQGYIISAVVPAIKEMRWQVDETGLHHLFGATCTARRGLNTIGQQLAGWP